MQISSVTVWCIVEHKRKTVSMYTRKLSAVYRHVEFEKGDKVSFEESTDVKAKAKWGSKKYRIIEVG